MLSVKCEELNSKLELNQEDVILYNESCYQILTQKVGSGWNQYYPAIVSKEAERLIENGSLVLDKKEKSKHHIGYNSFYKVNPELVR